MAASLSAVVDIFVYSMRTPCRSASSSAAALTPTGTAMRSPSRRSDTSCTNDSSAWVSLEHPALVVDERDALAVGLDHRAEVRAGGADERRPRRAACSPASKAITPGVDVKGLTASTSAPSLASTFGMTSEAVP